ncbi:purine-nucleoside phosphorylase [candidate division KSB1 bacterium]|nr:purine-nucleoside phosphorylase [candidate division KSB1 bacterium]
MKTLFTTLESDLLESRNFILKYLKINKPIAIILGSGLGSFGDELVNAQFIDTKDIPNYPMSTVEGHAGCWICGELNGEEVLAVRGRVHYYEGYSYQQVAYPVHLLAGLGITSLIVTNASGGLNPQFAPGDLMIIEDQINLTGNNPLIGPHIASHGPRFPDMSEPYDREYIRIAEQAAKELNIPIKKGVLTCVTGPSYETAAEVRMLQRLGGDASTMSTAPEVIAAVQRGIRVLGISCITNMATGIGKQKLTHAEVTATAEKVRVNFTNLIKACIFKIQQMSGI